MQESQFFCFWKANFLALTYASEENVSKIFIGLFSVGITNYGCKWPYKVCSVVDIISVAMCCVITGCNPSLALPPLGLRTQSTNQYQWPGHDMSRNVLMSILILHALWLRELKWINFSCACRLIIFIWNSTVLLFKDRRFT